MKINIVPEVGDKFRVKLGDGTLNWGFSYFDKTGGTGMSNWGHDERFTGEAIVEITQVWYDDETGYKCWAKAVNPELVEYMQRVAKPNDQRIFVGESDIEPIEPIIFKK